MIKQDRKLVSVNKQMNFQYGNIHMMKSKEGWRVFLIKKKSIQKDKG